MLINWFSIIKAPGGILLRKFKSAYFNFFVPRLNEVEEGGVAFLPPMSAVEVILS